VVGELRLCQRTVRSGMIIPDLDLESTGHKLLSRFQGIVELQSPGLMGNVHSNENRWDMVECLLYLHCGFSACDIYTRPNVQCHV
jgi:hypothetical protein